MKIHSITELRNTQKISKLVHQEKEPIFITKNGYGDMVLMSIEKYDELTKNKQVENKKIINKNEKLDYSLNSFGFLNTCAIPLEIKVADTTYNANRIIDAVKKQKNCDLIVFPELCLTSYSCGDLFLTRTLKDSCLENIKYILEETKKCNSVFIFGAPIEKDFKLYNCALVCFKGEILGVVPKSFIPNYSEFYEKRYFEKGKSEFSSINFFGKEIPFSTNLLFQNTFNPKEIIGVEICEDLWALNSPHINHINAGATIIVNLSASNETIEKDEQRKMLISSASKKGICSYIYASASYSESTTDLIFSGVTGICENGDFLDYSNPFENKTSCATIDLDYIINEREKNDSFLNLKNDDHLIIYYGNKTKNENFVFSYDKFPFIPKDDEKEKIYNKIIEMQSLSLSRRMKKTNSKHLIIGLSGGLDSTLAYLVCVKCVDFLNIPRKNIIAISMPCFGTSKRTKNNAEELALKYQTDFLEISIKDSVLQHLNDINQSLSEKNVTFENAQARERTQVLMDYANKVNGLVVGTGDLSEIALGWSTYNGDHMSMYSVNASLPKTLIRDMVLFFAQSSNCKEVLLDILNTPVSPELLPTDNQGNITQLTEDKIGPYELHDFFLYLFMKYHFSMKKILFIATKVFYDKYDETTIKKWLSLFIKRFFSQQFKRSCMPDGIKISTVSLSPRGDWRMPSDASYEEFLKEIDC